MLCVYFFFFMFFFFFKQKTAYEMSIGDWSSDVCSSDLHQRAGRPVRLGKPHPEQGQTGRSEERRVGKECNRRVDLGGRRIIKKKKENWEHEIQTHTATSSSFYFDRST